MIPIKDRDTGGKLLVEKLKESKWENTIVLALPRGGVPVAWQIANELEIPWDVLLVKKIGAPNQPEFAIGAVSEDEDPIWNEDSISHIDLPRSELSKLANRTHKKILEQTKKWRNGRESLEVKGKNVIVVDDGLATGMTMQAAIEFLNKREAKKIVVAVPVASESGISLLKDKVDEIIALQVPKSFFSVGQWYQEFTQVDDETVTKLLSTRTTQKSKIEVFEEVTIRTEKVVLRGNLSIPESPKGLIIFAHGSGSSRKSPRNKYVAKALNQLGFSTLLFDLLTAEESESRKNVFKISLLAKRLIAVTNWIRKYKGLGSLPIGYFGASTGAAAALEAAAQKKEISTVVSRGGRPDLAEGNLEDVKCPVLLIVGGSDLEVIKLNKEAKEKLVNCNLETIPGAGHLFEEQGALDKVIQYTGNWFLKTLAKEDVKLNPSEQIVYEISKLAYPLESEEGFGTLLDYISQSKIVMLGEATHGTEEFYKYRKDISKRLIEDYGFNFIAVEGDWPDCYKLNNYIRFLRDKYAKEIMREFRRWPSWMWSNEQTEDLIEWMKGRGVGFYGLDVYSLYSSLDIVKNYAKRLSPEIEKKILENYSCFDMYKRNEIEYAKSLIKWPDGCEKEILQNLRHILRIRLDDTNFLDSELFDFKQNAKIIRNAEGYYASMMYGGAASWNIRDEHMLDTLDSLLRYHGKNSKAIVWAHNSHIGDYHATDMVSEGYVNLGGLARERYGMENVCLVGFGTYEGTVLAGKAWDASPEVMKLPPGQSGSYEELFHRAAEKLNLEQFYVIMNGEKSLMTQRGHRAVGVVYQPELESRRGRNYTPTRLSQRYDTFVYLDKTNSLKPLPGVFDKGVLPDTWPIGV